uniref:hypothetical protein n=1 Tax=uncultured Muribaculum sp. TaxID=1918613 RepID=UPI0025B733B7
VVNPWLSARNAWWHNAGLRGFAGGVRPALRGAKAGHLRVAYLYWRVDWCREVETHKIKEY